MGRRKPKLLMLSKEEEYRRYIDGINNWNRRFVFVKKPNRIKPISRKQFFGDMK